MVEINIFRALVFQISVEVDGGIFGFVLRLKFGKNLKCFYVVFNQFLLKASLKALKVFIVEKLFDPI